MVMESTYEIVKCEHGETCYIKTGLTRRETYLKSFYVCSRGKCKFSKPAVEIKPMKCLVHAENYVGLSKPYIDEQSKAIRLCYSCQMCDKTKRWCGSILVQPENSKSINPLQDKQLSRVKSLHNEATSANNSFRENSQIKETSESDDSDNDNDDDDDDIQIIESKESQFISGEKKLITQSHGEGSTVQTEIKNIIKSVPQEHIDTSEFDVYVKKYSIPDLEVDLAGQKSLLRTLNLAKLPDGGKRIRSTVEKMTKALEYMKLTNDAKVDEENVKKMTSPPEIFTQQEQTMKYTDPLPLKSQASVGNNRPSSALGTTGPRESGGPISDAINNLHVQLESCPSSTAEVEGPSGLNVELMLHQKQALAWLAWRERQTPRGGILADDMGLGKTLTMISLIIKQKETNCKEIAQPSEWLEKSKLSFPSSSTLVVCPASLIHQWESEIAKRVKAGTLKVFMYHGPTRKENTNKLLKADVVLTTYNVVSLEVGAGDRKKLSDEPCNDKDESGALEKSSSPLLRIHWQRIILDEGHTIKNRKSVTALSACRLRADVRWILSGTPIHNDLSDVYSLLRFLRCSPFDDYRLWKRHVDNKSQYGEGRLNMIIKVLMLRRTKEQKCKTTGNSLVSLPPKEYKLHDICLSKEERKIYDKIFTKSRAKLQQYLDEHEERIKFKELGVKRIVQENQDKDEKGTSATQMLLLLLRLRQSCCHPYLMKEAAEVEDLKTEELDVDLVDQMSALSIVAGAVQDVDSSLASLFDMEAVSTKIKFLMEIMESVRQDCKVSGSPIKSVIVSQWTKMLDIVNHHLTKSKFRCCTIKGDIPAKKRSEIVDAFNSDPDGPEVMLLSLRAGGTGLNLIGGSHLYIIDMHWNPALEQQACDRIYRVGQTKNVFIHKFVCKETIEEKIAQLQQKKTNLATNVLTGVGGSSAKLSLKDLRILFGIESRHAF